MLPIKYNDDTTEQDFVDIEQYRAKYDAAPDLPTLLLELAFLIVFATLSHILLSIV